MSKSAELYLKNQLCFPLYVASRLTTKLYAPYLKKLDITYPQYLVLLVLWEENTQSVKQIGEKLFLESNTLTPLLKRLEQKQIIVRQRSKNDERTVLISLTEIGVKLKEKASHIPSEIANTLQNFDVNDEQIQNFKHTLLKLVKNIDEVVNLT